jgi:hypothetical protein
VRFLATFLGCVAALAIATSLLVQVVDPLGDFNTRLIRPVAPNPRLEKLDAYRAFAAAHPRNGLLLGSSRTAGLDVAQLGRRLDEPVFNFTANNSRAEDYLAIYRWSERQGVGLSSLYVGVDVEALHDAMPSEPQLRHNAELSRALAGAPPPGPLDRLLSAVELRHRTFRTLHVGQSLVGLMRLARGDQSWSALVASATPEQTRREFEQRLPSCLDDYVGRFRTMRALSSERRGQLEQLLQSARADGVSVSLWVTPLHPVTVERLEQRTDYRALLGQTVALVEQLGARYGARVHDFSSPARFDGTETDWIDCAHMSPPNARRLAERLAA